MTALIIGRNTDIGQALAAKLTDMKQSVLSVSTNDSQKQESELFWNTRSPISASSLVRTVFQNQDITNVFLVYTPGLENRVIHELPSAAIETLIDNQIKGYVFMCREITLIQRKNPKLRLHAVLHTAGSEVLAPLESAAVQFFRTMFSSTFTFYHQESILINGFESSTADAATFAEFIIREISDPNNRSNHKWHKYNERSSILNPLLDTFRKSK